MTVVLNKLLQIKLNIPSIEFSFGFSSISSCLAALASCKLFVYFGVVYYAFAFACCCYWLKDDIETLIGEWNSRNDRALQVMFSMHLVTKLIEQIRTLVLDLHCDLRRTKNHCRSVGVSVQLI